jgi:hypothetical protein
MKGWRICEGELLSCVGIRFHVACGSAIVIFDLSNVTLRCCGPDKNVLFLLPRTLCQRFVLLFCRFNGE